MQQYTYLFLCLYVYLISLVTNTNSNNAKASSNRAIHCTVGDLQTSRGQLQIAGGTLHQLASTQSQKAIAIDSRRTVEETQSINRSSLAAGGHIVNVNNHRNLTGTNGGGGAVVLLADHAVVHLLSLLLGFL